MSSLLGKNDGLFNPGLRFAFTNITDQDFVSAWDGSPIIVKSGQSVELPHHLANKLTDELVNRIMMGDAVIGGQKTKAEGMALGVPAAREVWEKKVVRSLAQDEESPEVQVMRATIKAELLQDMAKEAAPAGSVPQFSGEFAELGKDEPAKPKRAYRVKTIKTSAE